MDSEAVARAIREAEEVAAVRWCGPGSAEDARGSLRSLADTQRQASGGDYELVATGLGRSAQILLLTLSGRYGLESIRRKGQRYNTIILRGPGAFLEEVLWPMYEQQLGAIIRGQDAWLHGVLSSSLPERAGTDA